jgi:hypothetical protein
MLPLSYRGRLPDPLKNSPRRPRFALASHLYMIFVTVLCQILIKKSRRQNDF